MPYKWTLTSGNLPPGLSLQTLNSGRVGKLVGKPTTLGTYNWRYTVTDDTSPDPLSAYNDYTMTVSSSMFLRGLLVTENWVLPNIVKTGTLYTAYVGRLTVEEAGAENSVFTAAVIEGIKPSWLNVEISATTNGFDPFANKIVERYCYAVVSFSGTAPNATSTSKFRLRFTSSTGGFIDTGLISISVVEPGVDVESVPTTFKLSSNKSFINEGDSVTITLTTTNQANNSSHAYKIGGVSSSDINVPLEGTINVIEKSVEKPVYYTADLGPFGSHTFIINYIRQFYQEGSLTISAIADFTTESTEIMNVSLPSRVQLGVPGDVASINVNILDTSVTPAVPTFSLESSAASVQEGNPFTITLVTENVPVGTQVQYQVSGVDLNTFQRRSDGTVEPFLGIFVVGNDGTASKTFTPLANELVEPNRTFTISLPSKNVSTSVTITDAPPTYVLTRSATDIGEGESVTFNLKTTTIADGTTFAYKITGIQSTDIDKPLTGTITVDKGTAGLTVKALEDAFTESGLEGAFETMTFELPSIDRIAQVRIRDTSLTPPPRRYLIYAYTYGETSVILDGSQTLELGQPFKFLVYASETAAGIPIEYKIEGVPENCLTEPLVGTITPTRLSVAGNVIAWAEKRFNTINPGGSLALTLTISLPNVTTDGVTTPVISFLLKSPVVVASDPPTVNTTPTTTTTTTPAPSTNPVDIFAVSQEPNSAIPIGYIGVNYTQTFYITHTGGKPPLTWSVAAGALPAGLQIKTENGNTSGSRLYIQGAPSGPTGLTTFNIQGTDGSSSDTISFTIAIGNPPSDGGGPDPGGSGGGVLPGTPGNYDKEFESEANAF